MWSVLHISLCFAYATAIPSLLKRSVPGKSTPAKEFEVRLSGGFAPYAGQVIVYHQGVWGTVCDDGWDESDALVVCRELGYSGITMATKGSFFGSAGTITIEMVACYGNETRLSQCFYKTSVEQSVCRTGWRRNEAGVICQAGNTTDVRDIPKLRLSSHTDWEGSGLVEVFINGQWGRVCDFGWDFPNAEVVCRQLGYPGAEMSTCCGWYFGRGSGPPLMDNVRCNGNESSIFHCPHRGKDEVSCSRRQSAGVVCKLNKPNVRLVGSPLAHAGFVQIRHYGRWGSFCDWSWGLTQGHVVCRELGYSRALFTTFGELFEQQSGYIWVEEAQCTGNESSIFRCDLTYIRDNDEVWGCDHSHESGVICESSEKPGLNKTADVRLHGGKSTHMGRVEIKQHGFWHAVCSIGWDKLDADVVCRQLGFPEAVVEVGHGQFGSGSGPMWLTSIGCQGNETSLDQCVSAEWELETDCGKRYGAGVICKMDNITGDGEVRLRGSNETNQGRVEIKLGGVWGTISHKDWDIRDGHVVCRQLGYRRAVRVYSHSRYGKGDFIWLSDLNCTGEERSPLECPRELNYDLYASILNAGVECTNDTNYTSEVEVRLHGLNTSHAGHVQVKYNGTWGTICAVRDLTYRSAEVICRQLGQGPPVKNKFSNNECAATNHGADTVWLSDLNCQGYEDTIDQCPHRGWGILDPEFCRGCKPKYCSVCLICQPRDANVKDIPLRLVGSNLPYAGRVEVRYAGVWGVICPRQMNGSVFKVICRQLGYTDVLGDERLYRNPQYPYRQSRLYGKGNGPVWLSRVRCHGNETSLSQCQIDNPGEILWCSHHEALELMCRPRNFTPQYPIRLAGTSVSHAGLVEVFYNGSWGTVCSGLREWDFSTPNALVVCRQLGFGPAIRSSTSWLAPEFSNCPSREHATGAVWLTGVRCRGNESSLDQCPHSGWGVAKGACDSHTNDACLVCDNPQYQKSEIAVQLRGSEAPYAGRVKVRYQGVWGTLCANDWKLETAEVLCRQLGYQDVELDFTLYNADEYLPMEVYDEVLGPVWFNSDGCSGHEKTLSECNLRQERFCSNDNVELICKVANVSVNDFEVRLHGGNLSNEGRVEVFYGGLWGTVSAKKWDLTDAMVLCRQLGFTKAHGTYNKKPKGKRVIWFTDFECQGSEATLGQCKHNLLARAFSSYDKALDVFAHCGEDMESKTGPTETRISIPRASPTATVKIPRDTDSTIASVNIPRVFPTSTLKIPGASSETGSSTALLALTASPTKLLPSQTVITQRPSSTSTPSTETRISIPRASPTATVKIPRDTDSTIASVNIPRVFPTSTLKIPAASSETGSSTALLAFTASPTKLLPSQTVITQRPSSTSTPSTAGPPNKCPNIRCQNGGSCEQVKSTWKCYCFENFAGEYCEVYVGSNAVSMVLKMSLDQWDLIKFKKSLAEILTSHCNLNPCLDDENQNTKTKSQKKSLSFQPDDIIILQGYPKSWQGMDLLNVRLAVEIPNESGNAVIPHDILSALMVNVAPEIHRRIGHGVVFIDRVEIESGQASSASPEASGRKSDESDSVTPHKYALIVLGVLLGVVCLVAIIIIVLYFRKKKREETSLREGRLNDKPAENIRLMAL